jgi:hypothetical protein
LNLPKTKTWTSINETVTTNQKKGKKTPRSKNPNRPIKSQDPKTQLKNPKT